jgi:alkylation response protein AidB-like acyl-CoA dehydrogenase
VIARQEGKVEQEHVEALIVRLLADHPPSTTPVGEFLGAQFDVGLAWVQFPLGCGGFGGAPSLQRYVQQRLATEGAPSLGVRKTIGYGMVAPTLVEHGTPEQRDRYLRPLFTGEEIWCQLFSEPSAGSDLAGLATRGRRDGAEWVVNGQKVWTTLAHVSSFGLLLARTDPDAPKHQGITAFLVDLQSAGIEVRPLYQITGEAEFNEVFLTDVRIPDESRLGPVGGGWRTAITTLMNERVSIGGNAGEQSRGPIGVALEIWHQRWRDVDSPQARVLRDELMASWARNEAFRLTNLRAAAARRSGTPGPEGSVSKLAFAEDNQRIYELCVRLMGAHGLLYSSEYPRTRPGRHDRSDTAKAFLRARANSIEGGTSEVMRNILGERVLGLPREISVDTETAWSAIQRS